MFKIYDGRDNFFQWDLNRKLIINDKTIEQVHYCNRTSDCSLVVDVYDLDGLRVADVPNILLQTSWPIRVFGYNDQHTKFCDDFRVYPRSKPADYVYTEEEVRVWDDLSERIDEIEKNGISEEVVSSAVYAYLDENPIDLTGYATEDYVDERIDYYTDGFATTTYVDDAVASIPKPDLSGYALKTDIPTVPTKVSAFDNDAGYLTQHQSLANYYTKAEVDAKIPENVDLSKYALKSEIPDVSTFVTAQYVQTAINESAPDLSIYAKTTDIPDVSGYALKSEIPDVSGYQTEAQVNALIDAAMAEIVDGEAVSY